MIASVTWQNTLALMVNTISSAKGNRMDMTNEFWILFVMREKAKYYFVMREKAKYYYVPEFYKGAKQRHIFKLLRASLLRQVVPMPG